MNSMKQSGLVGLFVLLSSLFGNMQAMNNNINNNQVPVPTEFINTAVQTTETFTELSPSNSLPQQIIGSFTQLNIAPVIGYTKQTIEKVTITRIFPANQGSGSNQQNQN